MKRKISRIDGIPKIMLKNQIMGFLHGKTKQREKITKCGCLDFVETIHKNKAYPLIHCHIELDRCMNIERLKNAIELSSNYVPEILYKFDFRHYQFVNAGYRSENTIVFTNKKRVIPSQWNLSQKPQLQVIVNEQRKELVFSISHILTDGRGFLQYLYLLAALYNNPSLSFTEENHRDISSFKRMPLKRAAEQMKNGKMCTVIPLRGNSNETQCFCLNSKIAPDILTAISKKAKRGNATLNDVFLSAYARVIARRNNAAVVRVPCPVDLRPFLETAHYPQGLSIANMTGIYRDVTIEIEPCHSFSDTLEQVHIEMELQKSRCLFLSGIHLLGWMFHKIPHVLLKPIIKHAYQLRPISYTNLGKIDHKKLFFEGSRIRGCYVTGTYRQPPDFQLSISTYQNICTLNSMLIGSDSDAKLGQTILKQVKQELLEWADE